MIPEQCENISSSASDRWTKLTVKLPRRKWNVSKWDLARVPFIPFGFPIGVEETTSCSSSASNTLQERTLKERETNTVKRSFHRVSRRTFGLNVDWTFVSLRENHSDWVCLFDLEVRLNWAEEREFFIDSMHVEQSYLMWHRRLNTVEMKSILIENTNGFLFWSFKIDIFRLRDLQIILKGRSFVQRRSFKFITYTSTVTFSIVVSRRIFHLNFDFIRWTHDEMF